MAYTTFNAYFSRKMFGGQMERNIHCAAATEMFTCPTECHAHSAPAWVLKQADLERFQMSVRTENEPEWVSNEPQWGSNEPG